MNRTAANLLASARVAELRAQAEDLAAAARPPARITAPRSPGNRRLLLLIARERRRSARLLSELVK
jgi:hypothetical protein